LFLPIHSFRYFVSSSVLESDIPSSTDVPVEALIASLITWSKLALLVFDFSLFKALCVSSCTFTDFPMTVS
jgi:hypothetical protein